MAIFQCLCGEQSWRPYLPVGQLRPRAEAEKTFSYPLDLLLLKLHDERVLVAFGQRDGIRGRLGLSRGAGRWWDGRRGQVLPWWAAVSGQGTDEVGGQVICTVGGIHQSEPWLTISFAIAVGHAVPAIQWCGREWQVYSRWEKGCRVPGQPC